MKKLFLFISIFSTVALWSQLKFEKGYFIDNQEKRHEVLIKNFDWLKNPTTFKYKTEENAEEKTATVDDVKEFQVFGYNKLIRYTGKINVYKNNLDNLSYSPEPDFRDAKIFLYQLSTGKKNLYSYFSNEIQNFFYSDESGEIKILIYKIYNPEGNTSLLAINDKYKSQLNNIFSDNEAALKMVKSTEYIDSDLIKIFNKYNQVTSEQSNLSLNKVKTKIHLALKPGVNFSKFKFYSPSSPQSYDANLSSIDPKFSAEMEYILPFNKGKWSLLLEATYSSMNANSKSIDNDRDISIKYGYMEFPIGVRYSMFLNDKSKIFTNVKFPILTLKTQDGSLKYTSTTYYSDTYFTLDRMSSSFIFGLGYSYNNKYFVELNSSMKRSISDFIYFRNYFTYNSISIGYNIF
ncbi:hypothetical protein GCM10010992_17210 [Cloacibacterium rupense]|uniref:Outer membrane protein beta-barrel domain-containing protein n=1 Tax=Cloacibacterium rupense TaxID=517423 RepID=A0ABQ2NKR2_9FLAO|nr:hypothetical protein [Cloacibacterium rupense]GGP04502.1 hypothetical protein GCM10010992_17210 [Cloacibacterium rupense]